MSALCIASPAAPRAAEMVAPDKPSDRAQFIDARDLPVFVLRLAERRTVGTLNATSPPGMFTIGDVISASITAANTMAGPSPAPNPVWGRRIFWRNKKSRSCRIYRFGPLHRASTPALNEASVERALREGLTFRPVQPTVNDTLAWHLQRPAENRAKLSAGLTPEREKALLDAWRATPGNRN